MVRPVVATVLSRTRLRAPTAGVLFQGTTCRNVATKVGLNLSFARRYRQTLIWSRCAHTKPSTRYTAATHPEGPEHVPALVQEKLARFSKYTLNTYARPQIIVTHGKGCWVYATATEATSAQHEDVAPFKPKEPVRQYLDFTAGIAVNALGHGDEQIAAIMSSQASKISHASNLYHNEWAGELAQLLVQLTQRDGGLGWAPGSSQDGGAKVFFANSGTEANEGALKFARKIGKDRWVAANPSADISQCPKTALVCFGGGFHGRSMGALSVTTNPKYQAPFAPLIPNVRVGEFNDASPEALLSLIDEDTCGVIVEPIQGEGGVKGSDELFLRALRKRCDEVGAVLIFDEIQVSCALKTLFSLTHRPRIPVRPLSKRIDVGSW